MARKLTNFVINRVFEQKLRLFASRYCRGDLIDIGCGTKPYQALLAPYVTSHTGVDHEGTLHDKGNIDLFASAYDIPVEGATFDCAICTAVLEHLEERESLMERRRA